MRIFAIPSVGATNTPSVNIPRPVRTACSISSSFVFFIISPLAIMRTISNATSSRAFPPCSILRIISAMPGGPTIPSTRAATSLVIFTSTSRSGSNPLLRAALAVAYAFCSSFFNVSK